MPAERGILHHVTLADAVSALNAVFGLVAILLVAAGHVTAGALLIILAALGDGFDGLVARLGYGGGPFGSKIDSFSDLVAFGVAPAVLVFHRYHAVEIIPGMPGPGSFTLIAVGAVSAAFLVASILRLVRYEVFYANEPIRHFIGLSAPGGAVITTLVSLAGWPSRVTLPLVLAAALLMTSRLRLPKLRGALAPPSVIALVGVIAYPSGHDQLMPKIALLMMVVYVTYGPTFVRRRLAREERAPPTRPGPSS